MGQALNQAKQLFVASAYADTKTATGKGTIYAKSSAEDIFLSFINAKGERTRSDMMPVCNIMNVSAVSAENLREYIETWTITLDSDVNSGNPVAGQDYILRIKVANYLDSSDFNKYVKFGEVHATDGMTAASFYKKMALSIAKNFSKEQDKPILVYLGSTLVTASMKESDITGSASAITIKENKPYWNRNSFHWSRYRMEITDQGIVAGDDKAEVHWASITQATSTTEYFINGPKTADLEDFVLSLHGDYKQGGTYPLSSETLVDPSQEYNYLNIHYAYIGHNENPQRSEKDIVVVSTTASVINSIVSVINTATGKSFPSIDVG